MKQAMMTVMNEVNNGSVDNIIMNASQCWSCITCTFLNQPMFLACEMCSKSRPSQGPTPPVRQPSFQSDMDGSRISMLSELEMNSRELSMIDAIDSIIIGSTGLNPLEATLDDSNGNDRAPRRVERHHSSTCPNEDLDDDLDDNDLDDDFHLHNYEIGMQGTLILTDDPADYPSQYGTQKKKKQVGQVDAADGYAVTEEGLDVLGALAGSCTHPAALDPTMDDSLDHPQVSSSPSAVPKLYGTRRPMTCNATTGIYANVIGSSSHSDSTLATAPMGSSSTGLNSSDNGGMDNSTASLPTTRARAGLLVNHRRQQHQQLPAQQPQQQQPQSQSAVHPHYSSAAGGPEIHWNNNHRRTGGDTVSDISSVASSSVASAYRPFPSIGGSGISMDDSIASHYSERDKKRSSAAARTQAASMRTLNSNSLSSSSSSRALLMKRGTSTANVAPPTSKSHQRAAGFLLPSIDPPPVPTMDMPGDVDALFVFSKDRANANQRASASHTTTTAGSGSSTSTKSGGQRKSRAAMLTGMMNDHSMSQSAMSMTASTRRRMTNTNTNTNTTEPPSTPTTPPSTIKQKAGMQEQHPGELLLLDDALVSPNTRRKKSKQSKQSRRKLQGGIRAVMASLRLTTATATTGKSASC